MKALILISLLAAAALTSAAAQKREGRGPKIAKPRIEDTIKAKVYADNWFQLYINGELIATDSIKFIPHNVVSVDVLPSYPMTIAVMAKDNADAKTGMEYNNTQIGDGGFILKLGDGTVTGAAWKAKKFFWGPIGGDTEKPRTESIPIPKDWHAVDFDDSDWRNASEFSQEAVGPKKPFFDHDFDGAKFIWSGDLKLDNTVIFRHRVDSPPDGKTRSWDMTKPPFANPSTLNAAAAQPKERGRNAPEQAAPFQAFADSVNLRWDSEHLHIESNGLPHHPMMVGVTAWQQQIPLPQPYIGDNAWRIPLRAVPAEEPMSAKTNFFRGAIAIAANGVPIFNPIKNDGRTDTLLAGELDQWGGHCGRADDYHYHIAPVHLQEVLGKDKPLAYALDGYPIYGYEEPDGSAVTGLDEFNGHEDAAGNYHYHATKTYPYLNGGFHGEVTERGGQVDPQPRAQGIRPAQRPLRGAKITKFHSHGDEHHLHYELDGHTHTLNYQVHDDRSVTIEHVEPGGESTTETFSGKRQRGGGGDRTRREERGSARDAAAGRQAWITAHKDELDTDNDGAIALAEMMAEAKKVFSGYDTDGDGQITVDESKSPGVRSAMGGFVRGHFTELDRDQSGAISARELAEQAKRMFSKADADDDGKVAGEEFNRTAGGGGGGGRRGGGGEERRPPRADDNDRPKPRPRPQADTGNRGKPNILMVLVDDMGWKDMGFSGNTFVETPHCDRLAGEGVIFSHAYASAPNCAPTRACLLSGQYTPRHGVYTVVDDRHSPGQPHHKILAAESEASMATEVVTIAEALKPAGYATAMFGMWNLGRGRSGPETPTGQGFDRYVSTKTLGFQKDAYRDGERYLTDAFTDEIIEFIDASKDQPFFVYFAPHATHHPYDPKPELLAKYEAKGRRGPMRPDYAATIEALDTCIGRIHSALERNGMADNTLIVFTADNGGTPENVAPLRGSKGSLYDGGLRVPTFLWGAGVTAAGRVCSTPITSADFYPTLLEAAGIAAPGGQEPDGASLMPVARGSDLAERDLFWHFPCYIGRGAPSSAIRRGHFKLVQWFENDRFELFDLSTDLGEQNDLSKTMPEKVGELASALRAWQQSTAAALPSGANPDYDPSAQRKRGRDQRGKGRR